jgi:hypothetical protein
MARPVKKTNLRRKNSGMATTEAAFVIPLVVLAVAGVLAIMYLSFTAVYTKVALYDGLICRLERRSEPECRQLVIKRLEFLPWGKVVKLQLNPRARAKVTLNFSDQHSFNVHQSLPRELR